MPQRQPSRHHEKQPRGGHDDAPLPLDEPVVHERIEHGQQAARPLRPPRLGAQQDHGAESAQEQGEANVDPSGDRPTDERLSQNGQQAHWGVEGPVDGNGAQPVGRVDLHQIARVRQRPQGDRGDCQRQHGGSKHRAVLGVHRPACYGSRGWSPSWLLCGTGVPQKVALAVSPGRRPGVQPGLRPVKVISAS